MRRKEHQVQRTCSVPVPVISVNPAAGLPLPIVAHLASLPQDTPLTFQAPLVPHYTFS